MKALLIAFAVVLVAAFASATPADKKDSCAKSCPENYAPICGKSPSGKTDITFGSPCVMDNFNCGKKDEGENELQVIFKQLREISLFSAYIKKADGECPGKVPVRLS